MGALPRRRCSAGRSAPDRPAWAWAWPADGPVLRAFSVGGDAYAAGQHRGVDVAVGDVACDPRPCVGRRVVRRPGSDARPHGDDRDAATATRSLSRISGRSRTRQGATVAEGAAIADPGPSGEAEHDVPYVHLGIRVGDGESYVDPLELLPPRDAPNPPPAPAAPPASSAPPASAPPPPWSSRRHRPLRLRRRRHPRPCRRAPRPPTRRRPTSREPCSRRPAARSRRRCARRVQAECAARRDEGARDGKSDRLRTVAAVPFALARAGARKATSRMASRSAVSRAVVPRRLPATSRPGGSSARTHTAAASRDNRAADPARRSATAIDRAPADGARLASPVVLWQSRAGARGAPRPGARRCRCLRVSIGQEAAPYHWRP